MTAIPDNRKIRKEQLKGVVQTVTGTAVDNTDPENPVINDTGGGVESIATKGIRIDNTNPSVPILTSNPVVYVFNGQAATSNPDATGGGLITIEFQGSSVDSMAIGDVVTMELQCYLDTRNATDLISSISWGTASAGSVNIGSEGWNLSNNLVGYFTVKQSCTRISSDGYMVSNTFEIVTNIGVEIIKGGSLSLAGASGGAISPVVEVLFLEADVANRFQLISGIVSVYKQNQP